MIINHQIMIDSSYTTGQMTTKLLLESPRMIRVYTPPSYEYELNREYPVLYMHDGQNLFNDSDASFGVSWRVQEVLEQLGLEWIVVGVDCAHQNYRRFDEYGPWINETLSKQWLNIDQPLGGRGADYVTWFVEHLIPWAKQTYRISSEETFLMGSSMGGLISTYMMCRYPHIFPRVASLSSAFWFSQEDIEHYIRNANLSTVRRYYMDCGTAEVTGPITPSDYLQASERVSNILHSKQAPYLYTVVSGAAHNEIAWNQRLADVLNQLIR